MTSADRNDFVPAQEKLEWVTPKISLMDAGDTDRKNVVANNEFVGVVARQYGPS